MVFLIVGALYGTPIIMRITTHIYQKGKAKKEAIKNLEDLGYDVNKHYINMIFSLFANQKYKEDYKDSEEIKNVLISIPFFNWIDFVWDIIYLLGNHTHEPFWDDFSKITDKKIKYLLKENVISENKDKMQYIKDKKNFLKELENKYDNIEVHKDNSIIMISENDSEKQLYEKLEQLQEMILRKQQVTDESKQKLEYKNKEGNKNEKVQ